MMILLAANMHYSSSVYSPSIYSVLPDKTWFVLLGFTHAFYDQGLTACLSNSSLTSVYNNWCCRTHSSDFKLGTIFSTSLKAVKLTNQLQNNVMKLPAPSAGSAVTQGRKYT